MCRRPCVTALNSEKRELGWKWGRASAAETRLYLGHFINMPPSVPSVSAQPPFLPLFSPVWAFLTDACSPILRSFSVYSLFSIWNPHPYTTLLFFFGLRWWANWYRSVSISVRPAPCGMTWWKKMTCRPTWSVFLISSTTSRSRRSPIYGSCRKCW